jgi:hypothetical protein
MKHPPICSLDQLSLSARQVLNELREVMAQRNTMQPVKYRCCRFGNLPATELRNAFL